MEDIGTKNDNYCIVNGIRFDIEYDFTVLCSYCGAPCLGTYLLWYVIDGKQISLETDTGTLDCIIEDIVGESIDRDDYPALPVFFRHWNECIGCWEEELGASLDREDLLQAVSAMEAIQDKAIDPEHLAKTLAGIRTLIGVSITVDSQLWMMRN